MKIEVINLSRTSVHYFSARLDEEWVANGALGELVKNCDTFGNSVKGNVS